MSSSLAMQVVPAGEPWAAGGGAGSAAGGDLKPLPWDAASPGGGNDDLTEFL